MMKLQKLSTRRLFIGAILLFGLMTLQTQATPGDLDPSFGNGGKVTSAGFFGRAMAIQADGKIVVAGNGLERYNADGSLDTSFGTGGRVVLPGSDFGCGGSACHFDPFATAVAIQADGKIIAAGTGSTYDRDGDIWLYVVFALWRYNTDGSLDTSFGSGGRVLTLFSGGEGSLRDIAIQSDGKIVAAGYKRDNSWDFLTARYNPNGTLDTSFGSGGKVITSFGGIADEANDVVVQSDGKIIVAGENRNGTFQGPFVFNFALARYNTDGSLDSSFGTGGKVVTPFGDSFGAKAIAIQSDGKIIAVGSGGDFPNSGFALARYSTDGSLDASFGTGGKVLTLFAPGFGGGGAVTIQSDSKIVVSGYSSDRTNFSVVLARYNTDGSLDITFGSGGKVFTPFHDISPGNDMAIQADGKIIVLVPPGFNEPVFALFRYQGRTESGFTVTRSDDRNNATCVPGDCSLREAINAANSSATDDTINFASGLTRITLTNEIVINNAGALIINGIGASNLTIDGGVGTNRIFFSNQATATISGLTLTGGNGGNNDNGGAILKYGGSLTLDGVHVTGNTAAGYGGGVYYFGNDGRIINSTFSNNIGGSGGGIGNFGAVLTIVNSTISANTSADGGGGIYTDTGNATLRNVTIINNTAQLGGGIYNDDSEYPIPALLNLGNTIVAGNTATKGIAPEIWSHFSVPITSSGGNLVGNSPGNSANIPIYFQPTDIRDTNPMLGALANNGDSTPTHALLSGSPAIDKGINRLVSLLAPAFDQRGTGFARIRDGNGENIATVDIGAFEVQLGSSTVARITPFDLDGDGKADQAVFRSADRIWYLLRSNLGFTAAQFGNSTDKITPADFDGDGKTDISVFRDGVWYWLNSSNGAFNAVQFGIASDIPVPFDYTGDGRAELAVYRSGFWYSLNLANNQFNAVQFGNSIDKPVPADFDGDGKTDIAVYRDGFWYWLRNSDNGFRSAQFGTASDIPVVGDYDGDGKADQAVYRNGLWYVLGSTQGFFAEQFGIASDIPVPADYDGDGKTNIAVFRNGNWYFLRSQQGFGAVQFGTANDKPIPAAFMP